MIIIYLNLSHRSIAHTEYLEINEYSMWDKIIGNENSDSIQIYKITLLFEYTDSILVIISLGTHQV